MSKKNVPDEVLAKEWPFLTRGQVKDFKAAFSIFDKDGSGACLGAIPHPRPTSGGRLSTSQFPTVSNPPPMMPRPPRHGSSCDCVLVGACTPARDLSVSLISIAGRGTGELTLRAHVGWGDAQGRYLR